MSGFRYFVAGFLSVLDVTAAPVLYRYPHRNSAEALRGDWNRIGQDIARVFERIMAESDDDDE